MRPADVLDFWFGLPGSPEYGKERDFWFKKSDATDAQIRERFLALHEAAAGGALDTWTSTAEGAVALVIALDQFPRNMFRGTPGAFATDARALSVAGSIVANGADRGLMPVMRLFAYLPYEHSESHDMQQESVRLFADLSAQSELKSLTTWARSHHDIIERFGRFPHRNEILGRVSTPEEIEFLRQPGSSF